VVRVVTHGLAEYTPRTSWTYAQTCLTGFCQDEPFGQEKIRILCQDCEQELDFWSRWIKTMLWIVAGRLRRPQDQREPEVHQEELEADEGRSRPGERSGSSKKRTLLRGDIVRYDASYFRKPSAHEGVPLKATHRVVEPDALADLEEVDLEHVLIWDFCDVDEYTRTLQDKKYYPGGIVPTDPERLRRVKVKGKQGKRQLVSLATWKHREGQRAELRRKQTLVQASAFKGERSER